MIKKMGDLYFPEHFVIARYDGQPWHRRATWWVYNTYLHCEEDRISVRFVNKLLKEKRIYEWYRDETLSRTLYKAVDYSYFAIKAAQ